MTKIIKACTRERGYKFFIHYYAVGDISVCTLFGFPIYERINNLFWVLGCTFKVGKGK